MPQLLIFIVFPSSLLHPSCHPCLSSRRYLSWDLYLSSYLDPWRLHPSWCPCFSWCRLFVPSCSRLPSSLLTCFPEPGQWAPFLNLKPHPLLTTSDFFDFSFLFCSLLDFIRNTFSVPFNIPDQKKVPCGPI